MRLAIGVVLLPMGLILIAGSPTWGIQAVTALLPPSKEAAAVVNLSGGETYTGSFRAINGTVSVELIEKRAYGYGGVVSSPLYQVRDAASDSFSVLVPRTGEYVFVFRHGSYQWSAEQGAVLSYRPTSASLFPLGAGLVLIVIGVVFVFADALEEQRAHARARQAQPSRPPPLPPRSHRPR